MARLIISEYAAKKLLIGDVYQGISFTHITDFSTISIVAGNYVVKVDDGTKKRNQKGLVKIGLSGPSAIIQVKKFLEIGFKRVLLEPEVPHEQKSEQYISCTLVRDGVSVLYSKTGGNNVENNNEVIKQIISRSDFLAGTSIVDDKIPIQVLYRLLSAMRQSNISFLEINPFLLTEQEELLFLDAAVELDSSKLHFLPDWVVTHIQNDAPCSAVERGVEALNAQSTASFSLTVFDKNATVFTLLSGGGASLVVLDALVDAGMQELVANYGEYSGAPTREETRVYASALLSLLFASTAPRKVLIIAGGVANFTDITTTFSGIIDSCEEYLEEFKKQSVLVIVRRGGPRQAEGLVRLTVFFTEHNIRSIVSDASMSLPCVALEAKQFIEISV